MLIAVEACGYLVFLLKKGRLPYTFASENFYGEPHLYLSDHPYLPYFPQKAKAGGIEFNSWGGRGPEPERPKKRPRILCYGGSTTFDHLWPGFLQEMLGPGVEVLNMAQNGATTADTLVKLALLDVDLQPDYILALEGINDLEPSYATGFRPDYSHRRRHIGGHPYPVLRRLPRWLEYSSMFTLLKWKLVGARADLHDHYTRPFGVYDFKNGPFGLDTFQRNLRHINELAESAGAKLVLGTPPFYYQGAERAFGKDFAAGFQRGIRLENQIIRELAAKEPNILLAEAAGSFTPAEEHMVDFCHFKPAGARLVAKAFYEALRKAGL